MLLRFLVLAGLLAALAAALEQTPCADPKYSDWVGPDYQNSLRDCGWKKYLTESSSRLAKFVVPVIFAALLLLIYPFAMIFRCCCQWCGGSRRHPDGCCVGSPEWQDKTSDEKDAAYSRQGTVISWLLAFVVFIGSVLAVILMSVGYQKVNHGIGLLFDSIHVFVTWANTQATEIQTTMTLSDGSLIPPLTSSYFDDFHNKTRSLDNDVNRWRHDTNAQFVDRINVAEKIVAYVPILFILVCPVCVIFNIRRCLPVTASVGYYICAIVFFVLGGAFLFVDNPGRGFCGEIDAQLNGRRPGITQYYVVPRCEHDLPFARFKTQMDDVESSNAQSACERILNLCDSDPNWSVGTASIIFYCGALLDASSCTTFQNTYDFMSQVAVKANFPDTACTDVANEQCTIPHCADACSDPDNQLEAKRALNFTLFANTTYTAVRDNILPLLDCNNLVDRALTPFTTSDCTDTFDGVRLLGIGTLLYAASFTLGIPVLLVGAKRFFGFCGRHSQPTEPVVTAGVHVPAQGLPPQPPSNRPTDTV